VNNAALGIVVSLFLRKLNSILKTFASALELMFTAVLSWCGPSFFAFFLLVAESIEPSKGFSLALPLTGGRGSRSPSSQVSSIRLVPSSFFFFLFFQNCFVVVFVTLPVALYLYALKPVAAVASTAMLPTTIKSPVK
jgi:hypothetical protein